LRQGKRWVERAVEMKKKIQLRYKGRRRSFFELALKNDWIENE